MAFSYSSSPPYRSAPGLSRALPPLPAKATRALLSRPKTQRPSFAGVQITTKLPIMSPLPIVGPSPPGSAGPTPAHQSAGPTPAHRNGSFNHQRRGFPRTAASDCRPEMLHALPPAPRHTASIQELQSPGCCFRADLG
ncbi:unnamed protein product [Gadus morhua 'NCC']